MYQGRHEDQMRLLPHVHKFHGFEANAQTYFCDCGIETHDYATAKLLESRSEGYHVIALIVWLISLAGTFALIVKLWEWSWQ
jgi:hypothetical protein